MSQGSDSSGDKGAKVTQAAIASDWGVSPAYVSAQVKKGCPTTTLEAARQWRADHARYGVGYRSRGVANPEPTSENEPGAAAESPAPKSKTSLASLEASLRAAISVEEEAKRLVEEAQRAKKDATIAIRIAAYNKAREGRLATEAMIQKIKEREEILVPMDDAKGIIRRVVVPILNRLRTFAKTVALEVNPADDVHAEAVLSQRIEALISEVRLEFDPAHAA